MKQAIENYRKMYNALLPEMNANIEKYRKGNFRIKVINQDGTPAEAKINIEQKTHAFDFGTSALMIGAMGEKEKEYRDAVSNLFNLITTTFCWSVMETEPGKFRFEEGSEEIYRRPPSDRVLAFAKENNMKAKGQPLFCGRWCPDWVPQDIDILKEKWISYVKEVAKRYDGKYYMFDVVNESYATWSTWKNMSWLPIPIWDFVKWMLKTAGEIFSEKCVMERNEATHVNFGEYAEKYYEENKKLLEEGIRLDSIGMQFHFFTGRDCVEKHIGGVAGLQNIYHTYHKISSLGIPMYISEVTIPSVYENMSKEEGEELQAEILEKLYRLWFSIPNMKGIIYWNIKEGDAWANEGDCRGCLIDEYLRKKKSYYALEHLIKRQWNTSFCSETKSDGTLDFSGFYGSYDITAEVDGLRVKKQNVSFDKDNDLLIIEIENQKVSS